MGTADAPPWLDNGLAIGIDGNPIFIAGNAPLLLIRCDDKVCSGSTATIIDVGGGTGASIAIGIDGIPVVSYIDDTGLRIGRCDTVVCTTMTNTHIDGSGHGRTSIAVTIGGYPLVVYRGGNDLKAFLCNTLECTTGVATVLDTGTEARGDAASVRVGPDSLPVISYFEGAAIGSVIKVAKCVDPACFNPPTITTIDNEGGEGESYSTVIIGTDGLPNIVYRAEGEVVLTHCSDAACSTSSRTVLDATGLGYEPEGFVGRDGNIRVMYVDVDLSVLMLAACGDSACSTWTTEEILVPVPVGGTMSATLGADGFPNVIFDRPAGNLQFLRIGDPWTIPTP